MVKYIIAGLAGIALFFGGYGVGNDQGYKSGYKQGWTEGRKNFVLSVMSNIREKYEKEHGNG